MEKTLDNLTEEAKDFVSDNSHLEFFESPNEYIEFILAQTNLHDGLIMINKLADLIEEHTLAQDYMLIVGNNEEVHIDVEQLLEDSDYDGQIWEEE